MKIDDEIKKLDDDAAERRKLDWFADALHVFQEALIEHTGIAPGLVMVVSAEFGLRIGLSTGSTMQVMGPGGVMTVKSEQREAT